MMPSFLIATGRGDLLARECTQMNEESQYYGGLRRVAPYISAFSGKILMVQTENEF